MYVPLSRLSHLCGFVQASSAPKAIVGCCRVARVGLTIYPAQWRSSIPQPSLPPSLPSGPSHKRCIHTLRIPVQIIQGFECLEFQQTVLCRNKHPISNSSTMYRSFANTGRWLQSSNQHPPRRLFIVVVKCHGFRFGEAEKERTRGFLENERRLWHVLH